MKPRTSAPSLRRRQWNGMVEDGRAADEALREAIRIAEETRREAEQRRRKIDDSRRPRGAE